MTRDTIFPHLLAALVCAALAAARPAAAQELPSRSMDELNWLEFREIVPETVNTVILTTGTLEPHGVTANGADNLAPIAIARAIAPDVQALIAPHIPYGFTGSLAPYPGATHIPEEAYEPYVRAVLESLARNRFRNIVVLNGHGGPQTAVLQRVARDIAIERGVNTLVINWWSACAAVSRQVFGNPGGHAGENETAMIQAIDPALVKPELMSGITTSPYPPAGAWAATPFPSTIGLYEPGTGAPTDFDQARADAYFAAVVECVGDLVNETRRKWSVAGFE
jgi:creatinine amidohydrolase